jgi:hypothetical protein
MIKFSLCLTNYALRREDVWRSGCIDPSILDIGASWMRVASFTPRPLHPGEKTPVSFRQDAGWAPEPVWTTWTGKKTNLTITGARNPDFPAVQPVVNRYTDNATPALDDGISVKHFGHSASLSIFTGCPNRNGGDRKCLQTSVTNCSSAPSTVGTLNTAALLHLLWERWVLQLYSIYYGNIAYIVCPWGHRHHLNALSVSMHPWEIQTYLQSSFIP